MNGIGSGEWKDCALPHFVIEYSDNVSEHIDIRALMVVIKDAALATGLFPLGGLRIRTEPRHDYLIGDGHSDNMFLHITSTIGRGRTDQSKRDAAQSIMKAITDFLGPIFDDHPFALSFQLNEAPEEDLNLKKTSLHKFVERRKAVS